jgi:hypothetical protein
MRGLWLYCVTPPTVPLQEQPRYFSLLPTLPVIQAVPKNNSVTFQLLALCLNHAPMCTMEEHCKPNSVLSQLQSYCSKSNYMDTGIGNVLD